MYIDFVSFGLAKLVLSKEMGSQDNGKWGEVMCGMANLDQGVREVLLGEVMYKRI